MLTTFPVYQHLSGPTVVKKVHRPRCHPRRLLSHLVLRAGEVQVELLAIDGLAQDADGLAKPLLRAPADAG